MKSTMNKVDIKSKIILSRISFFLTLALLLTGFVIPTGNVFASNTTYTGLKLPFASGPWYYVANTHNVNPGDGRNAVDMGKPNGVEKSFAVLAMHDGKIQLSKDPNNGILMIDHQDGYCSLYAHLQLGTYPKDENGNTYQNGDSVKQGNQIAISGKTDADFIHLHVLVISKKGGASCPTFDPAKDEIRMIFDQIGEAPMVPGSYRPVDYGIKVTSNVSLVPHGTPPTIPHVFVNGWTRPWQDGNYNRANLTVHADNLAGQMIYVHFWRVGKDFGVVSQRATSNELTFYDLDLPGPMNRTTYYAQTAMNQNPDPAFWSADGCLKTSNYIYACDKITRP